MSSNKKDKRYIPLIVIASVAVPALVAMLYFVPKLDLGEGAFDWLPGFYATINGLTAVLLVVALVAIKKKNIQLHRLCMNTSMVFSLVFLLSYVLYHLTHDPTIFGGTGAIKPIYYTLLISHILLSTAIVPMVLITYVRALAERYDKHRKIAKITWPMWFYVTVTGVIVYLMISPYY